MSDQQTFVLSANYLDRNSPNKWLLRESSQKAKEATEWLAVIATDVIFRQSTQYEQGFGCSRVAYCKGIQSKIGTGTIELPKNAVRLKFGTLHFIGPNDNVVESCKQLFCNHKGEVYAVL